MYIHKISSLLLIFLVALPVSYAQNTISRNIRVEAQVIEQLKGSIRSVPDVKLDLIGLGECLTDENGSFEFEAPLHDFNRYDPYLNIEIRIRDFEVISPFNGLLQLDTAGYQVILEIVVIGRDLEEEYKKKLASLNKKLLKTKKENGLSLRRINAINDSLLHSIAQSQQEKAELENVIAELKLRSLQQTAENESLQAESENLKDEKNSLEDALNEATRQLEELSATLDERDNQLYIALEERYLRQQNIYKAISADFKDFLIRTKDVHDLLQSLDHYFRPGKYPNYVGSYNEALKNYNDIFIKINDNYLDYVQGVKRYWKSPMIAAEVEETFDKIFHQLHNPRLKPAMQEINGYILNNKKGKANKIAHSAFHDLNPLILNLEKSVDRTLNNLEEKM